ncbi:MAG: L-lactate permease, partial [Kiritimatiellae bacterium]|nr:L-lactate permease [Kiritimatiellia bacterium]
MPFAFVVVVLALGSVLASLGMKRISPGFLILAAAFAGGLAQKLSLPRLAALLFGTVRKYALALLTICLVLALARTMGESGMTTTLAESLVKVSGKGYPFLSGFVGALGGFMTGSGTSSNVLFGMLQASVGSVEAEKLLYAAANVMGAGIGKMVCPQSIVLGCAAAGLAGRESEAMRKAFAYFVAVLSVATTSVVLFSEFVQR